MYFFALVSKCICKISSKIRMHGYQSFILSTDSPAHLSWHKVHLFLSEQAAIRCFLLLWNVGLLCHY